MKQNQRHVVFICTELHATSAGTFRQERWLLAYLKHKYRCSIVHGKTEAESIATIETPKDYSTWRKKILSQNRKYTGAKDVPFAQVLRYIKYATNLELLNKTHISIGKKILTLNNKYPITTVFASTPPIQCARIAGYIKDQLPSVRLILDFRDQWAGNPFLPKAGITKRLKTQRRLMLKADEIYMASDYMRDAIAVDIKTRLVYNAPSVKDFAYLDSGATEISLPKAPYHYVYMGSLPPNFYDIPLIAELLMSLGKESSTRRISIGGKASTLKKKIGMQHKITFLGHLPYIEAEQMRHKSDILIFFGALGEKNGGIVTTKIFEYLSMKKPLLLIGIKQDSDVYKIVMKTCGHCPIIDSNESLRYYIENPTELPIPTNLQYLRGLYNQYMTLAGELA